MRLADRIAVVTGAASGIGAAVARRLSAEGAIVAVLDQDATKAAASAGMLRQATAITTDVSDSASVDRAFAQIVREYGTVDVLVNVAGISGNRDTDRDTRTRQRAQESANHGRASTPWHATDCLSDEHWHRMIGTHLDGTFYCCRAALRIMLPKRSGVIVNTASMLGLEGLAGLPHYSAAKGGILAFTRSLAKEVIDQGIRVNAVAPGAVDTPMTAGRLSAQEMAAHLTRIPVGRYATADEIAAVYVFLASDEASYIVGETCNVNGGALTV